MHINEFNTLLDIYNLEKLNKKNTIEKRIHGTKHNNFELTYLKECGYLDNNRKITSSGIKALEPYKVKNAVILAAGASTRFVPLSLEKPKGLFEVKGETLIERQIKQLHDAGITDITIVLGYKKEMFFYLKEKYGVNFIFNKHYNIKNNIESLYLARDKISNTYICSCDNYFIENPFNLYEYNSFYAGFDINKKTNEMYVEVDEDNKIINMRKGAERGKIILGHAYWSKDFADEMIRLMDEDREVGIYDNCFWEEMVKDNILRLPSFYLKEYYPNKIFEFDYFEELRKFDNEYIGYTRSEIIRNIKLVFRCNEEDIVDFRNVNEGMTNTSFIFKIKDVDYIYRHPGEGTENIVNRKNEKISLEIANELGIDPTYIYMDINEGWKISKFVHNFREPNYYDFNDSKKIIRVLQKLHKSTIKVDFGMQPWNDAEEMERLLVKKDPLCFKNFENLKNSIERLYLNTIGDGVEKCFCHGDTYKPNWMIKENGEVVLIDWEYSGYSDPGIDVGYYIVDAMYDIDEAKKFIREYLGETYSIINEYHFMVYIALIAYYWFVWALYRESCGAVIGESLFNWYNMAQKYADYLLIEEINII